MYLRREQDVRSDTTRAWLGRESLGIDPIRSLLTISVRID
jgi:hypothetical protein